VRRKVDILFSEFLQKLAGGAWQLHSDSLHSVAQFRRNRFHDRDRTVGVQINLLDSAHVQVFQKSRVGHSRRRDALVVRSVGLAIGTQSGKRGGDAERVLEHVSARVGDLFGSLFSFRRSDN